MSSTPIQRTQVERTIGGKLLSIETGHLAKQASGAVVVRVGDTMTLVATVAAPGREGLDFFPLTVDYREKIYAAGKFPGGFIKREGRPTTKEILTSRLIDRPIRPLFPESYRDEVQIQAGPISADRPERPRRALDDRRLGVACSWRRCRSSARSAPSAWAGSTASSSRSRRPRRWRTATSTWSSPAPRRPIVMIEGFGEELPEPEMVDAIMEAHRLNQEIIALQHELLEAAGLPPHEQPAAPADPLRQTIYDRYGDAAARRPSRS